MISSVINRTLRVGCKLLTGLLTFAKMSIYAEQSEEKKWCYTCKACRTNIKNRLVIPLTILKPLKRCLPQRPVGYISFYLEKDKWIKILLFALDNNMLHHMPGLYICMLDCNKNLLFKVNKNPFSRTNTPTVYFV